MKYQVKKGEYQIIIKIYLKHGKRVYRCIALHSKEGFNLFKEWYENW